MASSPLVSIVMPCYQQAAFLEEAVRSVLDQKGVDVELLAWIPAPQTALVNVCRR
jgi:hypothetical protein